MFNLTVETAHTFYVGEKGWLVHNTGPCGPTLENIIASSLDASPAKGLTQAGHALQSHAGRAGSLFPKPTGVKNPAAYNSLGRDMLEEILTNPSTYKITNPTRLYGPVIEYRNTSLGMGVRVDTNGKFMTFLDPNSKW